MVARGLLFVTLARYDDRDGGAKRLPNIRTTAALRDFLRAAQAHVDDIDEAVTAVENGGVAWIPRVILTGAQIDALGL